MHMLITSFYPKHVLFKVILTCTLCKLQYLKENDEGKADCLSDPKLIGQSEVIIIPIVSIAIKTTTTTNKSHTTGDRNKELPVNV